MLCVAIVTIYRQHSMSLDVGLHVEASSVLLHFKFV